MVRVLFCVIVKGESGVIVIIIGGDTMSVGHSIYYM